MRALLAAAVTLSFGACGGAPRTVQPPEHDAPTPAPHAVASDDGTLLKLEHGDRACYVTLRRASGDTTVPGDFELCPGGTYDAAPLVGQRVRIATKTDQLQAASCQGNPDCADSETVDLVVAILPAP